MLTQLNRHDRRTRGHTERVRAYSVMLGEEIGLDRSDLDRLNWAALAHDVGKLHVPVEILNKPGRPTAAEWEVLRSRPGAAADHVESLRPWALMVDRWCGKVTPMAELALLDRGYAAIMSSVVADGQAPHYTRLASELDIGLGEAKDLVHELVGLTPGWVHPGTDYLASFPPFNLQPTQYTVSIDGAKGWYAQCGFEALAIRWLVPGKQVRIGAPCLCCGEPISVVMQDEEITSIEPEQAVGYTTAEVGGDAASRPFR